MGKNFQQTLKCLSNNKFVLKQGHMFVKIKSKYCIFQNIFAVELLTEKMNDGVRWRLVATLLLKHYLFSFKTPSSSHQPYRIYVDFYVISKHKFK